MKYQQIGNILIFNDINKEKAQKLLKKFPGIKTICIKTGSIKGKFRKPQIKVIASRAKKNKTLAIHKESGIFYKLDVRKVMFSKGNINERHRIAKIAKKNEVVIDMFAGIGYFSLPIAKKVKEVYSIELNPIAYHYLLENIKLNKLTNIKAIKGDCSKVVPRLARLKIQADRIIMGLLPSPFKYLITAFKVAKKGTITHYSCLISRKEKDKDIKKIITDINSVAYQNSFKIRLLEAVFIKSYSSHFDHYVLDLVVL